MFRRVLLGVWLSRSEWTELTWSLGAGCSLIGWECGRKVSGWQWPMGKKWDPPHWTMPATSTQWLSQPGSDIVSGPGVRSEEYIPPILMTLAMVISCDPWYLVPVVSAGLSTLCQLLYDYHDNTPPRYFVRGERWKIGKTNFQSAKSLCKWF